MTAKSVSPQIPGGRTRAVRQLAEPGRFWIAYSPRSWRCAPGPYTDLANARLAGFRAQKKAALPGIALADLDDFFYLPPVPARLRRKRDRMAMELIETGTPVLVQLFPGDTTPVTGAQLVFDVLGLLLKGRLEKLEQLPEGATVVWPLIPGLTDDEELWEEASVRLKSIGVRCVQPLLVELTASIRRTLAEGREDHVFDALFHGDPPSERDFAHHFARQGFEIFTPRPAVGNTPRELSNRRLAAHLALAGDLWLRLERPVTFGQALLRGARGADSTHLDLKGLVRDKNLTVLAWLDTQGAELIREVVEIGQASLLTELLAEYLDLPPEKVPTGKAATGGVLRRPPLLL